MGEITPIWACFVSLNLFNGDNNMKKSNKPTYNDFVKEIVAEIKLAMQEDGLKWSSRFDLNGSFQLPLNSKSEHYSGLNLIKLWIKQSTLNLHSNQWATFKQLKSLGFNVLKGEKGTTIGYFNFYDKEVEGQDEKKHLAFFKRYSVFNLSQTDAKSEVIKIEQPDIQDLIESCGAEIQHHDQGRAFYNITRDVIKLPNQSLFDSEEGYYATLLHELVHWTGHETRLGRFERGVNKNTDYAKEELVAEIGATLLCRHFGIQAPLENHASYLKGWMTELSEKDFEEAVKLAGKSLTWLLRKLDQKDSTLSYAA
tara:strand:- start:2875 stop:3807 length:933 start_codon:yes stop_codon:yes gene_type:complete